MQLIKDEYLQFNLWSRPLKSGKFAFSELKTGIVKNPKSASGILVEQLKKAENDKDSGVLPAQHPASANEPIQDEDRYIAEARARLENREDLSALPRFRRLKAKIDSKVFDYSEIESEKIEEEIQNLVNRDGYYDEIVPIDADEEFTEKRPFNPLVIVVGGIIVALIVFLYVYIKSTF